MELLPGNTKPKADARFYTRYTISALALLAVLFCFAKFASTMSIIVFAFVLALLTAIATPTFAYVLFTSKLHDRTLLSETGYIAKITRGKSCASSSRSCFLFLRWPACCCRLFDGDNRNG